MSKTTPNRIAVEDLIGSFATPIPGPVLTPSKQNLERWEVRVDPEPPPFHVSPHLEHVRPVPEGQLLPAKTTASGRVTRRASSDPACFSHSGQGLARLSHDIG